MVLFARTGSSRGYWERSNMLNASKEPERPVYLPEKIFESISSLLSKPLPFVHIPGEDMGDINVFCPICRKESWHAYSGTSIVLKPTFKCSDCSAETIRCGRYPECPNLTTAPRFWEEPVCERCELSCKGNQAIAPSSTIYRGTEADDANPHQCRESLQGAALGAPPRLVDAPHTVDSEDGEHEAWMDVRDAVLHWPVPVARIRSFSR